MIDDNTFLYTKMSKMYLDIIRKNKIKKVEEPANLIDLHLIENAWNGERTLLALK